MADREIILFSAMAIDGFIARKNGNLDWLFEFDKETNGKEAGEIFNDFYSSIDTTIMGRKTYDQICREGQPNPYPEKENYVISKKKSEKNSFVNYYDKNIDDLVFRLKKKSGKPIWLVGGGLLNSYFQKMNHIDRIILDIIPVILGNGIKLFEGDEIFENNKYKLDKVNTYESKRIQVRYIRK
jgi:dihydrofolate reductase